MNKLKNIVEVQVFGVCTWLGERLRMRTSAIRLFFIYASFLALGSPLLIYLGMAFILNLKNYMNNKRSSIFDL